MTWTRFLVDFTTNHMIDYLKLAKEVVDNLGGINELRDFEHYAAQLNLVLGRWRNEERAKLHALAVNAGHAKYRRGTSEGSSPSASTFFLHDYELLI